MQSAWKDSAVGPAQAKSFEKKKMDFRSKGYQAFFDHFFFFKTSSQKLKRMKPYLGPFFAQLIIFLTAHSAPPAPPPPLKQMGMSAAIEPNTNQGGAAGLICMSRCEDLSASGHEGSSADPAGALALRWEVKGR